jgi:hypothetical protein
MAWKILILDFAGQAMIPGQHLIQAVGSNSHGSGEIGDHFQQLFALAV